LLRNNAAADSHVHIPLHNWASLLLEQVLWVKTARFSSAEMHHFASYLPHKRVRFPLGLPVSQAFGVCQLVGEKWYLPVASICRALIMKQVEQLLIYLRAACSKAMPLN
jgi:hypothetical protein